MNTVYTYPPSYIYFPDSRVNWATIQTLARSMSTLHKQLIIVDILPSPEDDAASVPYLKCENGTTIRVHYKVDEIAIASGHAPFKHKKKEFVKVGGQVKKQRKT